MNLWWQAYRFATSLGSRFEEDNKESATSPISGHMINYCNMAHGGLGQCS